MDLLEKINRSFASWYEGLFGGSDDVRPRDILRRILTALEDNRKEGFDNRVYVPNQYVLEINVDDEEEKEYLLSFLERDELEAAIRRYCQQNHYHIRGALDFTIREVEPSEAEGRKGEKVRVRCRYRPRPHQPSAQAGTEPPEDRTIAKVARDPAPTHAERASLQVESPGAQPFRFPLDGSAVHVGRSARGTNELVLEHDGQVSKRHARIELSTDGRFRVFDLGSTNGTRVNGSPVESSTLQDGDEVQLGQTRLTFQQSSAAALQEDPTIARSELPTGTGRSPFGGAAAVAEPVRYVQGQTPPRRELTGRTARLVVLDGGHEGEDFLLGSEAWVGRGVTNDIVLPDRSVSVRHACIRSDAGDYTLENLDHAVTRLNGAPVEPGSVELLSDGDEVQIGSFTCRFDLRDASR